MNIEQRLRRLDEATSQQERNPLPGFFDRLTDDELNKIEGLVRRGEDEAVTRLVNESWDEVMARPSSEEVREARRKARARKVGLMAE